MNRRKILVPIDFTDISTIGLNMAIDIAMHIDADIDLLHIIQDHSPVGFQTDADLQANERQESEHEHFMIELIKKRKHELNALVDKHSSLSVEIKPFIELGGFSDQEIVCDLRWSCCAATCYLLGFRTTWLRDA